MNESPATSLRRSSLPLILIAAVVQGWGLYGLSWTVDHRTWPAYSSGLLMALYALVTVLPLTLQFLADHRSQRLMWLLSAAVGLCYAGFGWHFGHNVSTEPYTGFFGHRDSTEQVMAGLVLWLMVLPFLQTRLITGKWWPQYTVFFAQAWRNKLTLAEAALFTGIFWGLLFLCNALFRMLGMHFISELYEKEVFAIPVTWLTFGISLHLITGMDRLASAVLQQLLNVMKWLTLPAVVILACFSVALLVTLPELATTNERTIRAGVLLWLTALIVLLFNAAYRDGETEQPYPRVFGLALRVLVPLTLLIVATATWSLYVRTSAYGFTVSRTWGWLVTGAAIAFSVGYSICATRKGRWMRGMSQVNVLVALAVAFIMALALTPVLSPYRISANSQYRTLLAGPPPMRKTLTNWRDDLFNELRFDGGEYGKARLRELASIENVPNAAEIRKSASLALTREIRQYTGSVDVQESLARLHVYPAGRSLDASLSEAILTTVKELNYQHYFFEGNEASGLFVDLTGDGTDEFVVISRAGGLAFELDGGLWKLSASLTLGARCMPVSPGAALAAGRFSVHAPHLADLTVGTRTYSAVPDTKCP